MLTVCCVNAGNYQGRGADYVNRLYSMVARNLDKGTEGRFVCFTDDATGLAPGICTEDLPAGVNGWWNKLWLFSPGLFNHNDRVVYFDLDTLIIGEIDTLAAYDGGFATLRDFYRPEGLQSSVMAWPGSWGAPIWNEWCRQGSPELPGGDQEWIEQIVGDGAVILQDRFPGQFVSFKKDCHPYPPEGSSVVVFHGDPKPHDCGRPWVESLWTESDAGHFQIGMVPNVPLDQIRAQINASAERKLPRLTSKPAHDRKVAIVGGGPSLSDPITISVLGRLRSEGCEVWALNGSYDWLRERDVLPEAHVVIDARPQNAIFLNNSRQETTYYVASQCHGDVYDKLARHDRNVVRLDLDVMGDCGSTVGTHAILTAFVEGFRDIHLFGFDSSYREDEGHAYQQALNGSERIVDAHIGDKVFKAAPWMVRQTQDFEGIARDVVAAGGAIAVYGDGLLPYKAYLLANPPPRAAVVRAREVLKRLPDGAATGAEIGVFRGEMSAALLARDDLSLLMIDSWEANGAAYAEAGEDFHAKLTVDEQKRFHQRACDAVKFAGDRATVVRMRSGDAAAFAPTGRYDFVFLDADHSYEGCAADIAAWAAKVKAGGLLCGHDYDHPEYEFGVKRAVDEFAARRGLPVDLGENLTWFIRL